MGSYAGRYMCVSNHNSNLPERHSKASAGHLLILRGLGGVVELMLPLALAAAVRVPYTTSPCSDLGQVVNLSLSVA